MSNCWPGVISADIVTVEMAATSQPDSDGNRSLGLSATVRACLRWLQARIPVVIRPQWAGAIGRVGDIPSQ